jgi:hypothetical protein
MSDELTPSWIWELEKANQEAGCIAGPDTKQAVRALLYGMASLATAVVNLDRTLSGMREDAQNRQLSEDLRRSITHQAGGEE